MSGEKRECVALDSNIFPNRKMRTWGGTKKEVEHRREREKMVARRLAEGMAKTNTTTPEFAPMSEDDQLNTYLPWMEVQARYWVQHLLPLLKGVAREGFRMIPREQDGNYDIIKETLLRRLGLTKKECHKRWWQAVDCGGMYDVYMLEHLLNTLPQVTWVKVQHPTSTWHAADLAFDYVRDRNLDSLYTVSKARKNRFPDTKEEEKPDMQKGRQRVTPWLSSIQLDHKQATEDRGCQRTGFVRREPCATTAKRGGTCRRTAWRKPSN